MKILQKKKKLYRFIQIYLGEIMAAELVSVVLFLRPN